MLYESKNIGPVPCNSPNLVLDFHIGLKDPNQRSIKLRHGIKKNLFREMWQNNITMEIGERWDSLMPSIQKKRKLCKYIMIICIILFFAIPVIVWFVGNGDFVELITIAGISAFCLLIIGIISCWFWLHGITNKFREEFVTKILKNYVIELPPRFGENFHFTILYPVIFYLPQQEIYCVLRISDGIVYCDPSGLEPIYFTTSEEMKQIHSKYSSKHKNKEYESAISYTPRSDTNPPILHQMRKDNRKNYSLLSPLTNTNNNTTPFINKINFNANSQQIQNINIQNVRILEEEDSD